MTTMDCLVDYKLDTTSSVNQKEKKQQQQQQQSIKGKSKAYKKDGGKKGKRLDTHISSPGGRKNHHDVSN